jgi:hypothetical protein
MIEKEPGLEKKKNISGDIKNFYLRNERNIDKYVTLPILTMVSLPAAAYQLGRIEKSNELKVMGTLLGMALSAGLAVGINSFQNNVKMELETNEFNLKQHYVSESNFLDIRGSSFFSKATGGVAIFTNNYFSTSMLLNPKNIPVTSIEVSGIDGEDEFDCSYRIKNFQPLNQITSELLINPMVKLNGYDVNGKEGKNFYSGLCKQILLDKQNSF